MRKLFVLLFLIVTLTPAYAVGVTGLSEVVLNQDEKINEITQIDNDFKPSTDISLNTEKTLKEKLNDIYHLEVEKIDEPTYLFKDILTKKFSENSKLESLQFGGGYVADWTLNMYDNGSVTNEYHYNAISPFIEGKFKNNAADFKIMARFSPKSSMNMMQYLFSDVYIATNKIPHHRLQLGTFRPQVGIEGMYNGYVLPFANRAQISRTFGNARKMGARVRGDYSLIDYEIGGYSSDTFFQEFFPGTEFISWVNFKPLGKTNNKYGNLKIGGGIQAGHRNSNYCVTGAYVGYEYKKIMANFEFANANGYNGFQTSSTDKHAMGFYSTLGYRITPKLQALVRYDEFNPNRDLSNKTNREYSFGLNYFIKGQGLRLLFNYVFCQNNSDKNSHKLILGTQILF